MPFYGKSVSDTEYSVGLKIPGVDGLVRLIVENAGFDSNKFLFADPDKTLI